MVRHPDTSPQTAALLASFLTDPQAWRYGYDLAKETGLKSGTLYPILARLAERGYLDRQWEINPPGGKPPRHLYRLTAEGLLVAGRLTSRQVQARKSTAIHLRWEGA